MGGRLSRQAAYKCLGLRQSPVERYSFIMSDEAHLLEDALVLPTDWERLWTDEIARRLREIDEGRAKLVDGDEALARARAVLKPQR